MKKKTVNRECPFQYLRRKGGNAPFPEETVRNWYIARAYVLDRLKDISFAPDSGDHLHAVVVGDSPLMLAVLRQLALSAHFVNFEEDSIPEHHPCRNRTVITLVTGVSASEIVEQLEKEENLCYLLKYCRYSLFGEVRNADSYIDIELEIDRDRPEGDLVLTEEEVKAFLESRDPDSVFSIDTRKAVYAGRAYGLGMVIDNIPYEDINSAGRYNRAIATFQYKVLRDDDDQGLVQEAEWEKNLSAVKNGLSNLFCADCFESREKAVSRFYPKKKRMGENELLAIWEKYNKPLSRSEHNRWVVEKLILGYRPMNGQERAEYAGLFEENRAAYIRRLKNRSGDPVHIDLCSYGALRRIDPDHLKYDSFLMMAIPLILDKIRKEDGV